MNMAPGRLRRDIPDGFETRLYAEMNMAPGRLRRDIPDGFETRLYTKMNMAPRKIVTGYSRRVSNPSLRRNEYGLWKIVTGHPVKTGFKPITQKPI